MPEGWQRKARRNEDLQRTARPPAEAGDRPSKKNPAGAGFISFGTEAENYFPVFFMF